MKRPILSLLALLLFSATAFGQTPQLFAVHEDVVKPSMDKTYRETMKKLKAECEKHKIAFSWTSFGINDGSYHHISPIGTLSDLEKNPFEELEKKMGKDQLAALMAEFDNCLESHTNAVIMSMPLVGYLAPQPGEVFRDVLYWTLIPGKEAQGEALMAEWKKLYEAKKAPSGFAAYRIVIGHEATFVIVSWGKDEADHALKAKQTHELLGESGWKLWERTLSITKKSYSKKAWMMQDASYQLASN